MSRRPGEISCHSDPKERPPAYNNNDNNNESGNLRKNRVYSDLSIVEIGKITEKCPGDLERFPVTQTPKKDHQLIIIIIIIIMKVEIRGRIETIQTSALLRSARLLRSVQETWRDFLSLRPQRKTISLRCWEKLVRCKIIIRACFNEIKSYQIDLQFYQIRVKTKKDKKNTSTNSKKVVVISVIVGALRTIPESKSEVAAQGLLEIRARIETIHTTAFL